MSDTKFGYEIDQQIGQLYFHSQGQKNIVGPTDIALAWTSDEDGNACLHKHGKSEFVAAKADQIRVIDPSLNTLTVPWELLMNEDLGLKVIEEINLCLEISGRISKLEECLTELQAQPQEGVVCDV